ncbi:MAG: helix-turn-helix transcriptional regulator [Clostridiaceae bacterium]|nr:helix-turn-helix transcriptional regulator [Clostridiaceae bacterium]
MPYTAYNDKADCSFTYVHFDFCLGNNSGILNDFSLAGIIPAEAVKKEAAIFKKACTEFEQSLPMSSIALKGSFTMLLSSILRYCSSFCNNNSDIRNEGNRNESNIKSKVRNYINRNKAMSDNNSHKRQNNPCSNFFQPFNTSNHDSNSQKSKSMAKLTVLQPVFQYVENNLDKQIKNNELATIVNMSEKYFISYFRSALGITPGNYITQLKMNKARDYLYQEKYSIKEIANILGYSDQYIFSKAFKKYFNVPPSKFL